MTDPQTLQRVDALLVALRENTQWTRTLCGLLALHGPAIQAFLEDEDDDEDDDEECDDDEESCAYCDDPGCDGCDPPPRRRRRS